MGQVNVGDASGALHISHNTTIDKDLTVTGNLINSGLTSITTSINTLNTKTQHQTGKATQTIFSDYTVCNHLQCNDIYIATAFMLIILILETQD